MKDDIDLVKLLKLNVANLEEFRNQNYDINMNVLNNERWMLDICLDYFSCRNPFRTELQKLDAVVANTLNDLISVLDFDKMSHVTGCIKLIYSRISDFVTSCCNSETEYDTSKLILILQPYCSCSSKKN